MQTGAEEGQTFPQSPQLSGSESRNVHAPLQSTVFGAQSYMHVPATHAPNSLRAASSQTWPQAPQL
jgi:hypothetical protein